MFSLFFAILAWIDVMFGKSFSLCHFIHLFQNKTDAMVHSEKQLSLSYELSNGTFWKCFPHAKCVCFRSMTFSV